MKCTTSVPKFPAARKKRNNISNINNVTVNKALETIESYMLVIEFE